jgi:hypothetical protein
MREFSTITIRDINGEIEHIMESDPNDLFVDNFGYWLAACFKPYDNSDSTTTLVDAGGNNRNVSVYRFAGLSTESFNTAGGAVTNGGTVIQVGSSSTAATRGDHAIGTPFGTAPESTFFSTSNGNYAAGTITVSGSITSGGSGTINEAVLMGNWFYNPGSGTEASFVLAHDVYGSGYAFTPGKSITVQWSITD